jgi:inorganic pyrophosphatase
VSEDEGLVDVFVETPQGSRKKYEYDPERKALRLDRRLFSAIGVFWIAYEETREAKILAVPCGDPTWDEVHDISELPDHLRDEISHFFDVYKVLEPGRTPRPDGYEGRDAALAVIAEARDRKGGGNEG